MLKKIWFEKFAETTEAVIIRGTKKIGFIPINCDERGRHINYGGINYGGGITIFSETCISDSTNEQEYYIRILVAKSELADASALDDDEIAIAIAIAIIDYDEIDPLIKGIDYMYRLHNEKNELNHKLRPHTLNELEGDYAETFYQTKTLGISIRGSTIDNYVNVTFHIENAMVTFKLSTLPEIKVFLEKAKSIIDGCYGVERKNSSAFS